MTISENLSQWLSNGERGVSSETIVEHLTGMDCLGVFCPDHPHDTDDFRRCRLLLEQCPELAPSLPKMSTLSCAWAGFVERWEELCSLMDEEAPEWRESKGLAPKTRALICELREDL